jgi:hypothetical protein
VARAETITKLPLDRWAKLIGIHPMHFNGVYDPNRPTTPCEQPWMQFPWQAADRVGREEVAQAISEAEADIEQYLGYRLLPVWETDEWHKGERPWRPELFNLSVTDIRGFAQTVQADWGYLITGGVRQKDLLEADAAIDYASLDGDDYDEVATVTGGVTVEAGTPACEVHVYFPVSNALVATAAEDQWEIKPINVTVVGTTATITFRREQCVLPQRYDDLVPPADDSHMRGVDGSVDANFLAEVDVYRVYNDPQTQATFLWEQLGIGCPCNGTGCGQCEYSTQAGCLTLRSEPRLSVVAYRPATWNADDLEFDSAALAINREPDIVRLYYYAGWRDKRLDCLTIRMDPHWERVIAYFAASKLDRPICECNNVRAYIGHWQHDLATAGENEFVKFLDKQLNNPFGTQRGAIYAWQRVKKQAIGQGVLP